MHGGACQTRGPASTLSLLRPPQTAPLAYPSNSVEASSTLSHHAAAERLGLLPRLTAVREPRSRRVGKGTHPTWVAPGATTGRGGSGTGVTGGARTWERETK